MSAEQARARRLADAEAIAAEHARIVTAADAREALEAKLHRLGIPAPGVLAVLALADAYARAGIDDEPSPRRTWRARHERLEALARMCVHDRPDPVPPPGVITVAKAAELLGVSERTVLRYRRELERRTASPGNFGGVMTDLFPLIVKVIAVLFAALILIRLTSWLARVIDRRARLRDLMDDGDGQGGVPPLTRTRPMALGDLVISREQEKYAAWQAARLRETSADLTEAIEVHPREWDGLGDVDPDWRLGGGSDGR